MITLLKRQILSHQSHLALECGYELAILGEDGEVEVVVVVRNGDLPRPVDANPDRVVRDSWMVFVSLYNLHGIKLNSNFIFSFLIVCNMLSIPSPPICRRKLPS